MAKATVQGKFYDSLKYRTADELIRKYAVGLCLDQIKLPRGGVLEKWNIGGQVVMLLCERSDNRGPEQFRVEVYVPATSGPTWHDLEKALALLADKKDPLKEFARKYMLAREIGQYTSLDEDAVKLLGGIYEEKTPTKEE